MNQQFPFNQQPNQQNQPVANTQNTMTGQETFQPNPPQPLDVIHQMFIHYSNHIIGRINESNEDLTRKLTTNETTSRKFNLEQILEKHEKEKTKLVEDHKKIVAILENENSKLRIEVEMLRKRNEEQNEKVKKELETFSDDFNSKLKELKRSSNSKVVLDFASEKKLNEIKRTLTVFENNVFDQTCKGMDSDLADLLEVALFWSICKCFMEKSKLLERKQFAETKFKEMIYGKFEIKERNRLIEFMHSQISILHSMMDNFVNFEWNWFEKSEVNNSNFECKNEFKMTTKNVNKVIYFSAIPSIHYGTQLSRKGRAFKIIYH